MARNTIQFLLCLAFALSGRCVLAITISTVPVGNPGNYADALTYYVYGSVSYNYRIATTEVTNAQYAEFLSAKAVSDPLDLYNTKMGSNAYGGITRSGSDGSYTYAPKTNMGNKPVNDVSWYDAIRFANWLHNGQGAGDTETGAYTLLGGTPTPTNGLNITRNAGATWFLPSENEWYKAAYYDATLADYWEYPTRSDSAPKFAEANSVGDISNPGTNVVNYSSGADWNGQDGNVTTVGSAGPLSKSFYGTSDQGGNVWEWNEALISGTYRGWRGDTFDGAGGGAYWERTYADPALENVIIGFRVATVPEPATVILFGAGLLVVVGAFSNRSRARRSDGHNEQCL